MTKPRQKARKGRRTILLVTASAGFGHMQAARNLAQAFRADPSPIRLVNLYDYITPWRRKIIEEAWKLLSVTPLLRRFYHLLHKLFTSNRTLSIVVHRAFLSAARRISEDIDLRGLKHVVALHPAAVSIGAFLKERTGCQLSVVATDFVLHGIQCHQGVDCYFAAPEVKLVGGLAGSADQSGRVLRTGIPIADEFGAPALRAIRQGPAASDFCVLVTFGASGLRGVPNLDLIVRLVTLSPVGVRFVLVAGHNDRFYTAVKTRLAPFIESKRVEVHGFVGEVATMMGKAHLVVGKPGGLTVSESLAAGLPMAIVDVLPGQEEYNAQFVERHGIGIVARDAPEIHRFIQLLLKPGSWEALRERILAFGRPSAHRGIAAMISQRPASRKAPSLRTRGQCVS